MAMPTVALAIAGASLTPSPTIATFVSSRSLRIASTLSSGIKSPQASSSPTSRATASATFLWSPEIIIMRVMPSSRSCFSASRAPSRGVSRSPMAPRSRSPLRTTMDVRPASRRFSMADAAEAPRGEMPLLPKSSALPIQTVSPPTVAVTPRPIKFSRLLAVGMGCCPKRSRPSFAIAAASGWSLKDSTATATASSSVSVTPSAVTTSVIRGRPSVSVPVLSNAIALREPSSSRGAPPFIRTPPRAARAIPERTALGVAMAKAHGLAATRTAMAR